jgi:hypothetical protein
MLQNAVVPFEFNPQGVATGTYNYSVTFSDVNNSSKKFTRLISVTVQAPTAGTSTYYKLEADKSQYDLKVTDTDHAEVATLTVYGYASNNVKNYESTLAASGYTFTLNTPSSVSSADKALYQTEVRTLGTLTLETTTASGGTLVSKLPTGSYSVTATKTGANNLNAYFTVTDTQAKPVLVVNKTYSTENDIASAVKDCVSVSLNGKSITLSSLVADYVVSANTGLTAFVKEVNYYEELGSTGIYVKHTIAINRTIKYNQD